MHRARVLANQGTDPGLPDIVPLKTSLDPAVRSALVRAIEQFVDGSTGPLERRDSVAQTLRRTLLKGSPSNEECTRMIGALVEAASAMEFAKGDDAWRKEHRRKLR